MAKAKNDAQEIKLEEEINKNEIPEIPTEEKQEVQEGVKLELLGNVRHSGKIYVKGGTHCFPQKDAEHLIKSGAAKKPEPEKK
ncbi:hypothetical protein [Ilyobacter sp.]|uniref:hypothetical protein n=1 Tax=Ilyobacter sp. TaxID=3100343 RepID=UPI003563E265